MCFKVVNKKNSDGSYTLRYGKGKKKLTAQMEHCGNKGWVVDHGSPGPFKTMKECKEAWGIWAVSRYNTGNGEPTEQVTGSVVPGRLPISPTRPSGPPPFKRSGPPKFSPEKSKTVPPSTPLNKAFNMCYTHDPFDGRMRYPSDYDDPSLKKQTTPLGILVEIDMWAQKHEKQIKIVVDNLITSGSTVRQNPFDALIESVRETIARECPDLIKK